MTQDFRALLIAENPALAGMLEKQLRERHRIARRARLPRVRSAAELAGYDVVIVVVHTIEAGLLEWLASVRSTGADQRMLVAASTASARDATACITAGADDCVPIATTAAELAARVTALLRRQPTLAHFIRFGPLELDRRSRQFRLRGTPLKLSWRTHQVLEALLMRRGGFVDKEQIADATTALEDEASANAVEQQIYRLRKLLASSELTIRTKRGLGYMLDAG